MKPFYPVDMKWTITQKFGVNVEAYPSRKGHPGIDFGTPTGCKLYAVCDGTITAAAYRKAGGYGREIFIQSGKWSVIYGHCSEILVAVGEKVKRGDLIGYSGGGLDDPQRGNSSGPHLHFEVRDLTQPQTYPLIGAVDPETWLASDNVISGNNDITWENIPPIDDKPVSGLPSASGGILTVVTDYINVRRDPSTNQPPIGRVLYGMDLPTTGRIEGNWHEVKFWVHDGNGEYLE